MMKYYVENNIAYAIFNNGKTNAITYDTLKILRNVIDDVSQNNEIKGLILTGEGKTFSSGFHPPLFLHLETFEQVVEFFLSVEHLFLDLFSLSKPVIAAMNGSAVAGGLLLALTADYRLVIDHPKIKIGMTEIRLGLGLTLAQTEIIYFTLGNFLNFRNLLYFGELNDIIWSKDHNIVDEIISEDKLIGRAREIIFNWVDNPNPGKGYKMLNDTLKRPFVDRIKYRLENENWQERFKVLLNPDVRTVLKKLEEVSI